MYGIEYTIEFEGETLRARAIGTADRFGFIGELDFAETKAAFARNAGWDARRELCHQLRAGALEALMGADEEAHLAEMAEGFR